MKKDYKLSQILKPLNKLLESNLDKENKRRVFSQEGREGREGLAGAVDCKPENMEELEKSKTKNFVDFDTAGKLIKELLNEKFPTIRFLVEKDRGASFIITAYELEAKDIGLDAKYQEVIERRTYITTVKMNQKQTTFGELGLYYSRYGFPQKTKIVSHIGFEQEWYDVKISETLQNKIKSFYERKVTKENEKDAQNKLFDETLKKYGITVEQFEELVSLRSK